jgi:hypothetical protein
MTDELDVRKTVRAIKKLAFSLDAFEPFPAAIIPASKLDQLIEENLVEAGPSCRPNVGPTGYRLTENGWRVARDRWTKR